MAADLTHCCNPGRCTSPRHFHLPGCTLPSGLFNQSRHEPLPLRPRRRQGADESPRLLGERDLSLASERFAGGEPSPFEFSPCFAQPQRGRLTGSVRHSQCNRRGCDPFAHIRRRPAPSGAINAVGLSRARFTANEARCRIGGDKPPSISWRNVWFWLTHQ